MKSRTGRKSKNATGERPSMPAGSLTKLFYSRREAAAMLSMGTRTLTELIRRQEIRVRRVGRRTYITAAELERFAGRDHVWHAIPKNRQGGKR